MSPLERLQYDMDGDDNSSSLSPAALSLPSHPPLTRVVNPRGATAVGRAGLVALRDAERILGSHAISLSGTAHALAIAADLPATMETQHYSTGRRAESPPVVVEVEEEVEIADDVDDPELSRLVRIIDSTQERLQRLEQNVSTASNDRQREAILKEIAMLHDALTLSSQPPLVPTVGISAVSVLNATRLRLAAAERVRNIRDMPITSSYRRGNSSPRRR